MVGGVIVPTKRETLVSANFRRLLAVAGGLALIFGLSQFSAQASTADSAEHGINLVREGCSSNHYHSVSHSGETLRVYMGYSSASGGTNCAWVEKTAHTGVRTDLAIRMGKCVAGNYNGRASCPLDGLWAVQDGDFFLYAGPVWKYGTASRCIWIQIAYRGSAYSTPFPVHHCG